MAVEVGQQAPDFTLKNGANDDVSLADFRGRNVVLVFYPAAFSGGCTAQFTGIGANERRYADAGAQVIGVSVDGRNTQRVFAEQLGLTDTILLADFEPKGAVSRLYGVYFEGAGISKRATFVIDHEGVVRGVVVTEPGAAHDEEEYFSALATCAA